MTTVLVLAVACVVAAYAQDAPKPHIIHIVADDLGNQDLGFRDRTHVIKSPVIDELATTGVVLDSFYTFKVCSPSRTMIMSGRYTYHYGYYGNSDAEGPDGGLPLDYTITPADLKRAGYSTHGAGKWHCGFRTKHQTPTFRGFDSFLGYMHAEENYFSHRFGGKKNPTDPTCEGAPCCGIDLLTGDKPNVIEPARNHLGVYSTELYSSYAVETIRNHDPSTPLYFYLPFQNVHGPTEAPPRFQAMFPDTMNAYRHKIAACIAALDEGIGNITKALKDKGMYNNSVIVFQSDNGGDVGGNGFGMNNYPLRGGKWTFWEGGVRVVSFVHSPLIPQHRRGTTFNGMVHSVDWRTTFAALAGVKPDESGPYPLDGFNVWPAIISGNDSPRQEVVHSIIKPPYNNKTCTMAGVHSNHPLCGAALRQGNFKLVVGYAGWPDLVFPVPVNGTGNKQEQPVNPEDPKLPCADMCLFDVVEDISETNDIKHERPDVVQRMLKRMDELAKEGLPRLARPQQDPRMCKAVESTGFWVPYQDNETAVEL